MNNILLGWNKFSMTLAVVIGLILTSVFAIAQTQRTGNAVLDSLIARKDSAGIKSKLLQLGNGDEKDMISLLNYYVYDSAKREAVVRLIKKRYPKGNLAYSEQARDLYKEEDPAAREKLVLDLKQRFPEQNFDQAYGAVSEAYANDNNMQKAQQYLAIIKSLSTRETVIGWDARAILEFDAVAADKLLTPLIERLKTEQTANPTKTKGVYYAYAELYSEILVKEKKYAEALTYVKEAYENNKHKEKQLITDYGLVLSKTGHYAEALPVLTQLVDEGKADAIIKDAFVESYSVAHPGGNAAAYLHQADIALEAKVSATVVKDMINEMAPAFILKDVHGKTVSLNDFKGKTIILDFWATWCGPCKASFPAMQRVVDHYKNDPGVKFLFVHTLETSANPLPAAREYLMNKHYNFSLYIDPKNPQTQKNNAVTALGIKGIPTKIVIDKNGAIRFKVLGFSGSDDDTVRELTSMIELANKGS